ncbi:MAG: chemotaxis protein CheW [Thermodesulfobacteriota bacterium]
MENSPGNKKKAKSAAASESKYLTFSLAEEEYGIGILKIREIIGLMNITPVPLTPDFVKGIINLRGTVIPVIDLRLRFGLPSLDYTDKTCIIIVEVEKKSGFLTMGIVVDSVSEVLSIKPEEIEPAPSFGTKTDTSYIQGIAKIKNGVKILLNIDKILTDKEVEILRKNS